MLALLGRSSGVDGCSVESGGVGSEGDATKGREAGASGAPAARMVAPQAGVAGRVFAISVVPAHPRRS